MVVSSINHNVLNSFIHGLNRYEMISFSEIQVIIFYYTEWIRLTKSNIPFESLKTGNSILYSYTILQVKVTI